MDLYKYQETCIKQVFSEYIKGCNRQLLALPCGAGKTIIFTSILKKFAEMVGTVPQILIIAQTNELESQAREKLLMVWPEAREELDKKIFIMSNIKANNRYHQGKFDICIIDEAHHGVSPTHMSLITKLGFLDSSRKLLIGVTATPERPDKIGLHNLFQKLVYHISIGELIQAGKLVPVEAYRFATLKTSDGKELTVDNLEHRMNNGGVTKSIIKAYITHALGMKTIIFCNSIRHAQIVYETFLAHKLKKVGYIDGTMSKPIRDEVIKSFHDGKIEILVNCKILREGFDDPAAQALIIAAPTASKIAYTQMVGRVMRTFPGKTHAVVIDVTDNAHKLVSAKDIDGLTYIKCPLCGQYRKEKETSKCKKCKTPFCSHCGSLADTLCGKHCKKRQCSQCNTELWNVYRCVKCSQVLCGKHGGYIQISKTKSDFICFFCIPVNDRKRKHPEHLVGKSRLAGENSKLQLFTSLPWVVKETGYYFSNQYLCLEIVKKNLWYAIAINGKASKRTYCLEYAFELVEKYILEKNLLDKLPEYSRKMSKAQEYFLITNGIDIKGLDFKKAQAQIIRIKKGGNKNGKRG
jgi:superfamily II DNA or RNA helicase